MMLTCYAKKQFAADVALNYLYRIFFVRTYIVCKQNKSYRCLTHLSSRGKERVCLPQQYASAKITRLFVLCEVKLYAQKSPNIIFYETNCIEMLVVMFVRTLRLINNFIIHYQPQELHLKQCMCASHYVLEA